MKKVLVIQKGRKKLQNKIECARLEHTHHLINLKFHIRINYTTDSKLPTLLIFNVFYMGSERKLTFSLSLAAKRHP